MWISLPHQVPNPYNILPSFNLPNYTKCNISYPCTFCISFLLIISEDDIAVHYYFDDKRTQGGLYNSQYEELAIHLDEEESNDDNNINTVDDGTSLDHHELTMNPAIPIISSPNQPPSTTPTQPPTEQSSDNDNDPTYSDIALAPSSITPPPPNPNVNHTQPPLSSIEAIIKVKEHKVLMHRGTDPTLPSRHIEHLAARERRSHSLQHFPVITPFNRSPPPDPSVRLITETDSEVLKNVLIAHLKEGNSLDFLSGNTHQPF